MTAGVAPGGMGPPPSAQYSMGFPSAEAAAAEGATSGLPAGPTLPGGIDTECCNLLDAHLLKMFAARQPHAVQLLTPQTVSESELQILLVHVGKYGQLNNIL